jgi:hypothetical protein
MIVGDWLDWMEEERVEEPVVELLLLEEELVEALDSEG